MYIQMYMYNYETENEAGGMDLYMYICVNK